MIESCFDKFWKAYPRKVKKKESKRIWKRDKLDSVIDDILKDLSVRPTQDKQWIDGYIPHPSTYLNGEFWEDEWIRFNEFVDNQVKSNSLGNKNMEAAKSALKRMT